jgi:hypothetical protein
MIKTYKAQSKLSFSYALQTYLFKAQYSKRHVQKISIPVTHRELNILKAKW